MKAIRDQRAIDADEIKSAYEAVECALSHVGRLLRTTEAGVYMWSSDHKSAVTGLKVIVRNLRRNVPAYGKREEDHP